LIIVNIILLKKKYVVSTLWNIRSLIWLSQKIVIKHLPCMIVPFYWALWRNEQWDKLVLPARGAVKTKGPQV
jgi:hypothetical protein